MYFYAPSTDEPHKEYVCQWVRDMIHGIGKRLSKNGLSPHALLRDSLRNLKKAFGDDCGTAWRHDWFPWRDNHGD
jgi:hypothetical protein